MYPALSLLTRRQQPHTPHPTFEKPSIEFGKRHNMCLFVYLLFKFDFYGVKYTRHLL